MIRSLKIIPLIFIFISLFSLCRSGEQSGKQVIEKQIILKSLSGRIDHMAVDLVHQRLFICALGNNTLEIADYNSGNYLHTIKIEEPQGVIYILSTDRFIVTSGGNGTCNMYDGKTYKLLSSITGLPDADNIRYDSVNQKIYVGYGGGAIAQIDAVHFTKTGEITLPTHPESFQIDQNRIYINIPGKDLIAFGDISKMTFTAVWSLQSTASNFPMDIDRKNKRLFIGCRNPAKILIYDLNSENYTGSLKCDGDIDDIYYDKKADKIFASCGAGYLDVYKQDSTNHYVLSKQISTARGARTSLFVPELQTLFLACPAKGDAYAHIDMISAKNL
jgi:WD40 repeat protein